MRCCHVPCGARPVDFPVSISNKLLLDIRRHVRKYYSVSIAAPRCGSFFFFSTGGSEGLRMKCRCNRGTNDLHLDQCDNATVNSAGEAKRKMV